MKKLVNFKGETSQRLDKFLSEKLKDFSRSQIQKWIENGFIKINKQVNTINKYLLENGDKINIDIPSDYESGGNQKFPKIKIIFEHNDFIVINKPAGLLTHPSHSNQESSVAEQIVALYPEIKKVGEDPLRPGIVHRIDKMVSGVLVVARNQKSFESLKQQFKDRSIDKSYLALVHGKIEQSEGEINFKLGRSKNKVRVIALPANSQEPEAREALTKFELIKHYKNNSLLKVKLVSGRTHQIRAHFHAFDHPLVGDRLYFQKRNKIANLEQVFLHAYQLKFKDLANNELEFIAPLPKTLKQYLNKLTELKDIFIVSGASGVGKSAVIIDLLNKYKNKLNLTTGTTYTTRELREIAEDKKIIKVTEDDFKKLIQDHKVAEWANVHENYYGTAADILEKELKHNHVILNIDIQGALQIQARYPEAWLIFIDAPLKDLKKRLESRGSNSPEDIKIRLENAENEKAFSKYYDIVIQNKNNKMDEAVDELKNFIESRA